jgi:mRNA-degrading endonuclease RelE of RelBE toxin-antitoxin system
MQFRISDTFTGSLAKLDGNEQKAVKTTAFDLQLNPASPGMSFHRIDRARDPNFWSVRVSRDLRLIVHKTDDSLLLCYVDHHDAAYRWAERRKIERHPETGAAQIVEIRETVREIVVPRVVEAEPASEPARPLLANVTEDELLGYGVPPEWIADALEADEDSLFELADHLPAEAAEALLDLATGTTPRRPPVVAADTDPFEHPEAQRRFRVMSDREELERALEAPWEKWTVFLHPAQRQLVEQDFSGPARVSGTAGTGKTIVALHRAAHLARSHLQARVLLATFSEPLAKALRSRLRLLIGSEPRIAERLEVQSLGRVGFTLYKARIGTPHVPTTEQMRKFLADAAERVGGHTFTSHFLWDEWKNVVDAWQLESWESYRDVQRLGRKTRLAESQRQVLWSIFSEVRTTLKDRGVITRAGLFDRLTRQLEESGRSPFDYAVIDEAQDVGVAELRFLAALAGDRPNGLFFVGDLGQRIFQQPFSWKALGVEVRGRSTTLRINYRTSHQIRRQADRLLDPELADVDGNVEDRRGAISVFNGPPPAIMLFDTVEDESRGVAGWIQARLQRRPER